MVPQIVRMFWQLQEPLQVTDVGQYLDGGTVFVLLTDAARRQYRLCFDRRMSSETHGWLYLGADHPDRAPAERVELGSELQGQVLSRLGATLAGAGEAERARLWLLADAIQRLRELSWEAR